MRFAWKWLSTFRPYNEVGQSNGNSAPNHDISREHVLLVQKAISNKQKIAGAPKRPRQKQCAAAAVVDSLLSTDIVFKVARLFPLLLNVTRET